MTEKVFLYGSLSPTITSLSLKLNRIVECSLTVTALLSVGGRQFEGCFKNIIKPRENDLVFWSKFKDSARYRTGCGQ